jgi:hypothetical protein
MAYKIEYILLIGILAFLLYHLLGSCNCNDGFSVGGCEIAINSCEDKVFKKRNISCDRLYEPNEYTGEKTKCIVDTVNASNCVATPYLCKSDPMNPTNLQPISIDDIKKSKSNPYYINPNEILIILKSNGSQTLEIDGGGTNVLYILGNIYIENGATLNINMLVNYNAMVGTLSKKATIINNGKLNISNHLYDYIFFGIPMDGVHMESISKLTNNGIITFQGTDPGSINAHKSKGSSSMVTYNNIDITGTGKIIYNNTDTAYNDSVNIDNTQTFNNCTIASISKSLSFNKPLTLNMSSFYITKDMTILAPANITIDKSYMEINSDFTSDNMTITDSNIKISDIGKLNIKILTMDQSNLTVINKANINSEVIIFKNESNLIIDKEWSGSFTESNITIDYTSSIIVNE